MLQPVFASNGQGRSDYSAHAGAACTGGAPFAALSAPSDVIHVGQAVTRQEGEICGARGTRERTAPWTS